jgi:O-antigen/teichoic acid export membrane protein
VSGDEDSEREAAKREETKRENQRAARDAGTFAFSRIVAQLLQFAALMVATRIYSKPEFGYLGALLVVYETTIALGTLGLTDSVFFFIGRDPQSGNRIVRQTSLLLALFALPMVAIGTAAGWAMSDDELDIVPVLPWIALAMALELPTLSAVNQLIASKRVRLASGLFIGLGLLLPLAILFPKLAGLPLAPTVAIAMAVASGARLLVHLVIMRRCFPLESGHARGAWLDKQRMREILWFALPIGVGALAGKLNPQVDKYAARLLLDVDSFANYTTAAREFPLITLVPYAIAAVMQTRYVQLFHAGEKQALRDLWDHNVRKTALIVVPMAMVIIALGRDVIVVMFGAQYADAALPFQIFTAVILHRVAGYGAMLQSIDRTRVVMISALMLIVGNALLTVPLTMLFGYPGPALASVIALIPPMLFTLGQIGSVWGRGLVDALPWRFYFAVLALSAVLGVAVWAGLQQLPLGVGGRLIVGLVAYAAAFVILGRALGMIEREDLRYVWRWLTLRMFKH